MTALRSLAALAVLILAAGCVGVVPIPVQTGERVVAAPETDGDGY
jgi:hypothetical protein